MDNTVKERQRRYRKRLYNAGFKNFIVWVKREEGKMLGKMSMTEFVKQMKILTTDMDNGTKTYLLNLLIKIANGKKEEVKLRKKK